MLASMIPGAPPAQPDYVDLIKKVQEASFEILYVNWGIMGLDNMVQALRRSFLVDQVPV